MSRQLFMEEVRVFVRSIISLCPDAVPVPHWRSLGTFQAADVLINRQLNRG